MKKNILLYKEYWASVSYSNEDNVFFGKIEGINDLINFEGQSVDELKASFIEAVDDYIETCKEIGKEPLKPYKGTFNIRISPELHKVLASKAVEEGISLNSLIEKTLEKDLLRK